MLTASSNSDARARERVEARRGGARVAVGADVIAADGVDRDQQDAAAAAVGVEVVHHGIADAEHEPGRDRQHAPVAVGEAQVEGDAWRAAPRPRWGR